MEIITDLIIAHQVKNPSLTYERILKDIENRLQNHMLKVRMNNEKVTKSTDTWVDSQKDQQDKKREAIKAQRSIWRSNKPDHRIFKKISFDNFLHGCNILLDDYKYVEKHYLEKERSGGLKVFFQSIEQNEYLVTDYLCAEMFDTDKVMYRNLRNAELLSKKKELSDKYEGYTMDEYYENTRNKLKNSIYPCTETRNEEIRRIIRRWLFKKHQAFSCHK